MNKFFSRYGRKNKYNAVRSTCRLGHNHRSRVESEYCAELGIRQRIGEVKRFEFERCFHLNVKGRHVCDIYPDFFIRFSDGRLEAHEVKGKELPPWPTKWRLMQALYPQYNYVVVKWNPLSDSSMPALLFWFVSLWLFYHRYFTFLNGEKNEKATVLGRFAVLRLCRADFSGTNFTLDITMGRTEKIVRLLLGLFISFMLVAVLTDSVSNLYYHWKTGDEGVYDRWKQWKIKKED